MWEQAEELKKQTVEVAVAKIHAQHEINLQKLVKAHKKALKVRLNSEDLRI